MAGPIAVVLLPAVSLFLGAGIAAGEQSRRTIGFLQSLPVPTQWSAIAKLVGAMATAWIVCFAALGFLLISRWLRGSSEFPNHPITPELMVIAYGLTATSLLIWMAAAGVNRKDEVQAGALGLLVILVCWALLGLFSVGHGANDSFWNSLIYAAAPGGVASIFSQWDHQAYLRELGVEPPSLWPPIIAAVITHGILVMWYVLRFGRVVHGRRQTVETLAHMPDVTWLKPPRSRPWTAILWKQARESMPLAALGAGTILCVAIIIASVVYRDGGEFGAGFAFAAGGTWVIAGFLVSVVAGIGLLMDDLRPGLYGFWRSRPIDVDQWFAVKFTVSLLTTVLTLALPTALIYGGVVALSGGGASVEGLVVGDGQFWVTVTVGLLAQVGAFSIAAAAMAFTRQPVTAAIVAILTAICVVALSEKYATTGIQVAAFTVIVTVAATLAAWLAVRNNWGWKH